LSYTEQCQRRVIYGYNKIAIHVTSIIKLLFKEVSVANISIHSLVLKTNQ